MDAIICNNCQCGTHNKISLGEAAYSLQNCAGRCLEHPACETFEYSSSTGQCNRCLDSNHRERSDYNADAVYKGKPGEIFS